MNVVTTTLNDSKARLVRLQEDVVERGTLLKEQLEIRLDLKVGQLRDAGMHTLYGLAQTVTEAAADFTAKVPVASRVTESFSAKAACYAKAQTAVTLPPVDGYDALSVKEILAALPDLGNHGVDKVRAHESANKGRVTILRAVEKRLKPTR